MPDVSLENSAARRAWGGYHAQLLQERHAVEVQPRPSNLALLELYHLREGHIDAAPCRRNITGRTLQWSGLRAPPPKLHHRSLLIGDHQRGLDPTIREGRGPALQVAAHALRPLEGLARG